MVEHQLPKLTTYLLAQKQTFNILRRKAAPLIGPVSQAPKFCRMYWSRSGAGHAPLRSRYWVQPAAAGIGQRVRRATLLDVL